MSVDVGRQVNLIGFFSVKGSSRAAQSNLRQHFASNSKAAGCPEADGFALSPQDGALQA
jgi:hypothetical protein